MLKVFFFGESAFFNPVVHLQFYITMKLINEIHSIEKFDLCPKELFWPLFFKPEPFENVGVIKRFSVVKNKYNFFNIFEFFLTSFPKICRNNFWIWRLFSDQF